MLVFVVKQSSHIEGCYDGFLYAAASAPSAAKARQVLRDSMIVDYDRCDYCGDMRWDLGYLNEFASREDVIEYAESKWSEEYGDERVPITELDDCQLLSIVDGSSREDFWFFDGRIQDHHPHPPYSIRSNEFEWLREWEHVNDSEEDYIAWLCEWVQENDPDASD